jgi:hypothetical protein
MKAILIHALMLSGLLVAGGALGTDWRKEGDDAERLQKLVELVPGTAHWMIEMGDRYQNLYWAAKQGKWEFATYQSEEIEKLMQVVMLARPKRAASAQMFLDKMFPMMHEATASKDWDRFEDAFDTLNTECMACHAREDHSFVVIPREPATASSPVLNLK